MRRTPLLLACSLLLGCRAVTPPPMLPMHDGTAPGRAGETSVMVVVGAAIQGLGGGGFGAVLRVEHQQTSSTRLGVELGGGKGTEDNHPTDKTAHAIPHWLVSARGYGRTSPGDHDWFAATYGVGLLAMDSGLLALTAHGGGAVSAPNQYVVPVLQLAPAFSLPILRGAAWGDNPRQPRPQLWLTGTGGVVVPIGDTGNAASLEAGVAIGIAAEDPDGSLVSLSIADRQRIDDGAP